MSKHPGILCELPKVGEEVEITIDGRTWVSAVFIAVDDDRALPIFRSGVKYVCAGAFRWKDKHRDISKFIEDLEHLLEKYDLMIAASGYDSIQLWDREDDGELISGGIQNMTKQERGE